MKAVRISLYGLLIWALLLAISTGYRAFQGFTREPPPELKVDTLQIDADWIAGKEVQLAYRSYGSPKDQTPILLLHGNPMASQAVQPLAQALPTKHYILSPDLNGLGYSSRNLIAYSAINQASILLAWLDSHDIKQVHAVAYSQGGAVALELAHRTPERIQSVSLIASVGLQEHELLGSYELNQPVYALYHVFAWSLRWLTPHLGLFDHPTFSTTTVDNFADTDLRLNRRRLEQLQHPTLILHSTQDKLVPYAAAKAHAELVPHASFENLPGGHMGIFNDTEEYADHIATFLATVESGEAYTRTSPIAKNRSHQPGIHLDPTANTRFLHVLLLSALLFLLVFASEDLSCIAGGILAASGAMPLSAAIAGCFLGIWVSDVLIYMIGHTFGAGALKSRFFRRINEDDYRRYQMAYGERGFKIVFLTRFIPGSRVIAYLTAGILRLGVIRFTIWLFLAAGVWTPILVTAAYLIGHPLIDWWAAYGLKLLPVIALCIVALYFSIGLICKSFTYRGRAELRGRWIRLTQWEYWPALPVYFPVFLYGCWLALRYRSTTLWALSNPGMQPISGLAMESKSEILKSLNEASNKLPEWTLLPESANATERLHAFQQFQAKRSDTWPVVFKPDVGQRGEGVAVIRNLNEAERYLSANSEAIIVQANASGPEFGVFYYRLPGESTGRIFSITQKVLPELTGDGTRSLERLILDDPRAVAMAKHYLKVNAERIQQVPALGEKIQLVELGTHCRGAIFLDGGTLASDALASALDEVVSTYHGFYFGRFDLRVSSTEALQAGADFKILELNGVSSESTDVYDPKNSILHGWRKLCRQWGLAFAIGAANRDAGQKAPSWPEIIGVIHCHRKRQHFEAADL